MVFGMHEDIANICPRDKHTDLNIRWPQLNLKIIGSPQALNFIFIKGQGHFHFMAYSGRAVKCTGLKICRFRSAVWVQILVLTLLSLAGHLINIITTHPLVHLNFQHSTCMCGTIGPTQVYGKLLNGRAPRPRPGQQRPPVNFQVSCHKGLIM